MIKMMVLKELNTKEQSGYDLMKKIGGLNNDKPSPGYMYPLLRDLEKRGFVSCIEDKRRKVYSITKEGRKFLNSLASKHEQMMTSMIKNFEPIITKGEMNEFYKLHSKMQQHRDKTMSDMDVLDRLRKALFSTYEKNYDKKRPKIRSIIKKATQQLERLSKE